MHVVLLILALIAFFIIAYSLNRQATRWKRNGRWGNRT